MEDRFLYPFSLIHKKWQFHLLSMLKENISGSKIKEDVNKAWTDYPKGFVAFVHKEKVPPGGQGLAKYLAKYLVSPPISVRRIEHYDGQFVTYWYRDHKTHSIVHEKQSPYSNSLGEWFSTFCRKGFSESVITVFTAMYDMFRTEYCLHRYPPAIRMFLNQAFECSRENDLNSSFLKILVKVPLDAHAATLLWNWS